MTPAERKYRRTIRTLLHYGGAVSRMGWSTPLDRGERFLEVHKDMMREFDRAMKKAKETLCH